MPRITTPSPRTTRGRLVFAPSRYGADIVGGAEAVQRDLAIGLQKRGWEVEVATTCATDHHTWDNVLPEGVTELDGIPVHRFPAEPVVPAHGIHEQAVLRGERMSVNDQYRWLNTGMRSPRLYDHLLHTHRRYRGMVFTPYPTWLTVAGSQIAPRRSVLWTCLHDEPYAGLDIFTTMFESVAGLLLQSDPEQHLLRRLVRRPAPHDIVGCTVPIAASYDPDGFRQRYGIDGPFVLFAGRREGAKGWEELLDAFERATLRLDLPFTLVTMGGGAVNPPPAIEDRVVDVGYLPDHERDNAFAAASAYLQPSRYEAFSRTIMEAWLAGTLVIGNADSEVVRWHCERSGAGLTYRDDFELEECLAFLADQPAAAAELAAAGRSYVLEHYDPDDVIDRIDHLPDTWLHEPWEA
jgi:glycosyltransferase involved in cell wall biosynthesis